ncbi:MAG: TrmH family RNA methyltransferase, partial [Flavobacteriaceae bacterium]
TESTGLENSWSKASHHNLIIPMHSSIDSLNLSVSAGILMYEAARKNKRLE